MKALRPRHTTVELDSPRSWSVAIAAAVATGVAFGTIYTFGALFESMSAEFGVGRGATAVVFGITLMCFFGAGILTGPLADHVGPGLPVVAGGVVMAVGLWSTSKVTTVEAGYITYGLGVGLGGSLVATPVWASVGMCFLRYRALAMGVVAAGNGLGTLILVPSTQRLIDASGWRSTLTVLAAVVLATVVPAGAIMARPAPDDRASIRAVVGGVVRRREFRLMFGVAVFFSVSVFVPFGFVVDFATGAGISSGRAAFLVAVIGAASVVGRLGLTALAARFTALRLLQWCLLAQPCAFAFWLTAGNSYALHVAFAVLMGVAYGGFVSLGPEVMAVLFGTARVGSIMGLLFVGFGLGGLLGPPLAGWLADVASESATITLAMTVAAIACALGWMIPSPQRR